MQFSYKARTKEGIVQKGAIEASSRQAALDVLGKYGFYVTSLLETAKQSIFAKNIRIGREVSSKDLVVFTRQIATMLKSAIPPLETFRAQVSQTNNARFREKVLKMAESLESGKTLSQAFSMFPKIFNPFFVSIIKSGEATGKVSDSFTYLADHMEREYNFNQKVKSALMYPAFVVLVFFGSFSVVVFFIVPKLSEILKGFNQEELPLATKGLIALADFITAGGWVLAPVFVAPLIAVPIIIKRSQQAKEFFYKYSLKLPFLGPFYKKIYLSRFAENLSVLMSAGLPITRAIRITKEIISNTVYKNILKQAEKRVSRGERISAILTSHPKEFPPFVTQMVSTGEETGRLDKTLLEMVRFYRGEIERATEKMTTLLEPILIIVLGIGIAILAFSVFVPLFNVGLSGM